MLVFPLQHTLILLPGARVLLRVSDEIANQLAEASRSSSAPGLTVAATPVINAKSAGSSERAVINEWACDSRVTRIIRQSVLSQRESFEVTLVGKERVKVNLSPARALITNAAELGTDSDDNDNSTSEGRGEQKLLDCAVEYPPAETTPKRENVIDFKGAALKLLDRFSQNVGKGFRRDSWSRLATTVEDASDARTPWLADVMVWSIVTDYKDRLGFLALANTDERLRRATELFVKQLSISEVTQKITSAVDESLSKQQKELFLRQQLAAIQRELASLDGTRRRRGGILGDGEIDEETNEDDMAGIRKKIETLVSGSEERKMADREWRRLKRIPQQSAEHGVIQNYLEWLTSLPWPTTAPKENPGSTLIRDRLFLKRTREQLDADHYGLDKIKKRLIEYLAVLRLRQMSLDAEQSQGTEVEKATAQQIDTAEDTDSASSKAPAPVLNVQKDSSAPETHSPQPRPKRGARTATTKGPILLFVGPPGTGKTSLGQSIARALGRPFQRISLGGVRDEAEIRGHRRTYIASGPGLIVQALRKAGRLDPVILLDEIDKVGPSNYHGDVGSALLEVLDPEQNHTFNDHYVNVPIDLSQVLFICTANTLETMSPPLLDRCEIVSLSGYTYPEKTHIARRFLLPKQLRANVLEATQLEIGDGVLQHIVHGYTHEAGVRSLERSIGAVVRAKAVEWADAIDSDLQASYDPQVRVEDLEGILGIARWDGDEREREARRGLVYGLVVTGAGEGGVLPVETTAVPGNGKLKLTGSLGDVIRESGELALSWVKAHAYLMGITGEPGQDPLKVPEAVDVHLHLPSGAQKKDGPSAGVAMVCAFVSLLTGALVPANVAMTGEITLRGRVTPVGGIKEKVLGAHRAGIDKLILPMSNRREYEHDVPKEVKQAMDVCFVRTIEEALEGAFGKGMVRWRRATDGGGVGGRGVGGLFYEARL